MARCSLIVSFCSLSSWLTVHSLGHCAHSLGHWARFFSALVGFLRLGPRAFCHHCSVSSVGFFFVCVWGGGGGGGVSVSSAQFPLSHDPCLHLDYFVNNILTVNSVRNLCRSLICCVAQLQITAALQKFMLDLSNK